MERASTDDLISYAMSRAKRCTVCDLPQVEEINKGWTDAGVRATAIRNWLWDKFEVHMTVDRIRSHFERGHHL